MPIHSENPRSGQRRERQEDLSERGRQLLRVAAMLGLAFRISDVAHLLQETAATLSPVVDEALRNGVLRDQGECLVFSDPATRRRVLEQTPSAVVHALRSDIDRMLGGGAGPPVVVTPTLGEILRDYAPEKAPAVVRGLALRKGPAAAEAVVAELLGSGGSQPVDAEIGCVAAHVLLWSGRPGEARDLAGRVLKAGAARPAVLDQARAAQLLAQHVQSGPQAAKHPPSALDDRCRSAKAAETAAKIVRADLCWNDGKLSDGLRLACEAAEEASGTPSAWLLLPWLSDIDKLVAVGHSDAAGSALRRAMRTIEADMFHAHAGLFETKHAHMLLRDGQLAAAAERASTAITLCREAGASLVAARALAALAGIALRQGDLQSASGYIAEYRAAQEASAALPSPQYDWIELRLIAERDGPREALRQLRGRLRGVTDSAAVFAEEPGAAAFLVRLSLAGGDRGLAEQAGARADQLAAAHPQFPVLTTTAAHARGLLDGSRTQLARAAIDHQDTWAAACAAMDLESLPPVDGPGPPIAAEPSRAGRAPWSKLTERETAVAQLAAEGLTNQQIATRIRVSPHTVNYHLRGVFRKLNVRSRVELARQVH
ncbi:helix-turn-helix transcriptional regulator [Actinomadura rudentiformis]|uniref:Helix-turn-helix transcriptional regulator n=1 Tax=Actinomadura rudentiformis TaxID=359158 RepID=A0A6H9YSH2_9ACTN|nr:LuxR C-terminal-related transcriptional regulator [Actinomadura rudentiformis]KAB2346958.1 helix-turn-helix transcriptional regulator [Actinomadura rudentiformis]